MNNRRRRSKSVQIKLFFSLCIVIIITIIFLIIINNIVLETFYIYSKKDTVKGLYEQINDKYNNNISEEQIFEYVKEQSTRNNLDIYIKNNKNNEIITNTKANMESLDKIYKLLNLNQKNRLRNTLYKSEKVVIKIVKDNTSTRTHILLHAILDNKNEIIIRTPVSAIKESLRISNQVLIFVGGISVAISAIIASVVSKRFSNPILELNSIAKRMSNLDFSKKYAPSDSYDEMDELGISINMLSEKLEHTIKELRENNDDLERDIKQKAKIDEMRTQFISDVSHELKTPIALIQGYAEGLIENVNTDEASRNFYAGVILDEADKMDKLVKQLLELMKLEYGKREFNNRKFDIVALAQEVIRNCNVMIKEKGINISFEQGEPMFVWADDFYIEQVLTNYLTNAIKYAEEMNGRKIIEISVKQCEGECIRVSIYNTGKPFSEEEMKAIWGRFYKIDASRNRQNGGTGIGLSIVKAVMNNYKNKYGVNNKQDGVEFYFELKMA